MPIIIITVFALSDKGAIVKDIIKLKSDFFQIVLIAN